MAFLAGDMKIKGCKTNLSFPADKVGGGDELDGVPERGLLAYPGQDAQGVLRHFHILFFASVYGGGEVACLLWNLILFYCSFIKLMT